jgi:hypothetical protein
MAPGLSEQNRLRRWRVLTVALMVTGYVGYYLCRSDLSVALPLLIAELGTKGIAPDDARIQLGTVASLGVLAYAIGKYPADGWRIFWVADATFLREWRGPLCSRFCSDSPAAFRSSRWHGSAIV